MIGYDSSEDRRPLTYLNGYAIYASTILVALHVLTMVGTAMALASKQSWVFGVLHFSSHDILTRASLWEFVTYAFLNGPSIWFAIEMFLLYRFGREVEQYLGRRAFLRMYLLLLVLVPAALTLAGMWWPMGYTGSGALHFAVFVAFAALYPGVGVFFGVSAKWIAMVLLGIYTLQFFSAGAWDALIAFWVSAAAAFLYVGFARGRFHLPAWQFWNRGPKFHVVRADSDGQGDEDSLDSIDPLLEKISRSGMDSLTRKERARLEKAREALIKKEPPAAWPKSH